MKKLRQFDPLVIEELVKEQFHQPTHGQNYYEIVCIIKGEGIHYLNGVPTDYQANNLFFISPADTHYLEIWQETHFGAIKFTDSYFIEKLRLRPNILLKEQPDVRILNRIFSEQQLPIDKHSQVMVDRLIRNLLDCKNDKNLADSSFIFFQILSLISLFEQLWSDTNMSQDWKPHKDQLIAFIHQHIYEPERIQIKNLAQTFHISANYFSVYFKNNFGISYRQYVDNYRIKLIENRIKAGFTLKQIADEFGFSDESHLSHFFKKHHRITFSQYRSEEKE